MSKATQSDLERAHGPWNKLCSITARLTEVQMASRGCGDCFSADPVEDVLHSVVAGGVFIGTSQPTERSKLEAGVPVPGPVLPRVER